MHYVNIYMNASKKDNVPTYYVCEYYLYLPTVYFLFTNYYYYIYDFYFNYYCC